MDNLTYSFFDLELPEKLNKLSNVIRYSQCILEKLTQMDHIHYEELTVITLYRQLIENVDGLFVLVDHGLESPSTSVARAAYEVFLQLEFMFKEEENVNRKALSYYSTWLFKEITFISKQLKIKEPLLPKEVLEEKLKNNNLLLDTEFQIFKEEILRTKKRLKINYPPKWYSLYNGPNSLGDLSKETSLKYAHSVLYNGMSAEAHGLKSTTNLSKSNLHLNLAPVRSSDLFLISMPIDLGRSFLMTTTLKIIKTYLPNDHEEFKQFVNIFYEK